MFYDSNAEGDGSNGGNVRAPIVIAVSFSSFTQLFYFIFRKLEIIIPIKCIQVDRPTDQEPVPCRSEITVKCSVAHKEGESKNDGLFKCYKRRRVSACVV